MTILSLYYKIHIVKNMFSTRNIFSQINYNSYLFGFQVFKPQISWEAINIQPNRSTGFIDIDHVRQQNVCVYV